MRISATMAYQKLSVVLFREREGCPNGRGDSYNLTWRRIIKAAGSSHW